MLIANRYRVIFITYVNNETLNDFYSTLLIAKYNNNLKIAGHAVAQSAPRTFF